MDEENQDQHKNPAFESLDILISRWKDGTFGEIIDDWKWIFTYSARYKGAIVFYIILGIFSTSMGLVSSVARSCSCAGTTILVALPSAIFP